MDNLHLQFTPVQITYQSKDPISVSCLFKKIVISTGHLLEKHQIKSNSEFRAGKASFADGPVFSMSKDFQLSNTKISLHFLAKKERNISCIGSAEIDVAALPNQPYSMLEVKLDNCTDPKAKIKLEVQRKETQQSKRSRKEEPKREKMDLLSTEGQRKEEMIINRRANPNFPTAYEISKRNYKQVQINCHEDKKTDKKSTSSKKSTSYQKRHYAINTLNANNKPGRNEEGARQSPMPRRQTPEPIQLNAKQAIKPTLANKHKAKESSLQGQQNRQTFGRSNEETVEQPQYLKVKPYPEEARENIQNYDYNGFHNLQDERNHKYKYITQKLQKIHDKIATSKDKRRLLTQENSQNVSECDQLSHQYHRSCLEKSVVIEDKSEVHQAKSQAKSAISAVNSFNPLSSSQVVDSNSNEQTPNILASLNDSPQQKDGNLQLKDQHKAIEQKFEKIKDMKEKSPSASPPSQKTISFKNNPSYRQKALLKQPQNNNSQQQLIEDKQIAQAEIEVYKKEIENYKKELVAALRNIADKNKYIQEIETQLEECKTSLKDKQSLLSKLNEEYEREFENNFVLKEKIAQLEGKGKRQESIVGQLKISELSKSESIRGNDHSAELKAISDELVKAKKRSLDAENQLKFKENENKCLLLQIDNIKREKRSLQQEIQILVSKDRNEMTRKASLARIEQINTSSLAQHTKRENQALKSQVKILLQKLQSLNLLFQSFIKTGERPELPQKSIPRQGEIDKKYKILQQKCALLEQQLKKKKNEMAEIINLIWKHQSGDLMNEVFALITQS